MNDEPTVEAAVPAREEILTARTWPPPATSTLTLHASTGGALGRSPGPAGMRSFAGDPGGFATGSTGNVTFTSAPFEQDTILLGLPKLTLSSAVTLAPLHLIATLYSKHAYDLRRISQCAMNPQLRDGADHVAAVVPGRRMQLQPPCFTVSQHVRAGDRLVLKVATSDVDKLPLFSLDPNVRVYTGGADGTRIEIPVSTARTYADRAPIAAAAIKDP